MKPLHGRPDRLIGQEGQNRRFVRIRLNPSIIAEMTITVLDGKKVKSRPAKVMLHDLNQQGYIITSLKLYGTDVASDSVLSDLFQDISFVRLIMNARTE